MAVHEYWDNEYTRRSEQQTGSVNNRNIRRWKISRISICIGFAAFNSMAADIHKTGRLGSNFLNKLVCCLIPSPAKSQVSECPKYLRILDASSSGSTNNYAIKRLMGNGEALQPG